MKNLKRVLSLLLVACMSAALLVGCGKTSEGESDGKTAAEGTTETGSKTPAAETKKEPFYKTLDKNVSGSISIMCWSGDSVYYENIGANKWAPEEITSQNVAAIYAMAKEFNKLYPNVKINLWAKADDPNANETSWYQEMENFKAEHGKYPDIYASTDLSGDVSKGLVADLSVYKDDILYQSFNEGIMKTMSYYGFQAGLPQFVQPWGVYVNKALAEANNLDVPNYNWTIDEYTDFVTSVDGKDGFWGAMDTPLSFIATGTTTVNAQMTNYTGTGDRVNIASDEVLDLLSYIPKWATSAIWAQNGLGNVPAEIMNDGWWWGYRFFCRNYLLTYDGDPWMLNAATAGKDADGNYYTNAVESTDWDIYPRPATKYQGNTVGICVDPMAIHNYAMDDNNPAWSDEEKAKFDLAYAFGSFWCGATEAMQARADQQFSNNGALQSCLNDSMPLVTGEEFDKQMKIWYSTESHKRYGDKDLMPGFQYVMQLWEEGKIWDISDKTYPYYVMEDGNQVTCLYEWLNATQVDVAGAGSTDVNWIDNVKAKLSDWNTKINGRFKVAETLLKEGLKKYYGFTEADFK